MTMTNPIYRLAGWFANKHVSSSACLFTISLDAGFAVKARELVFNSGEFKEIFQSRVREMVGDKTAEVDFYENTGFLRSMKVAGDCTCLFVHGDDLTKDWSDMDVITYHGHNVDSKTQAYDLLAIFTHWVDSIEAFIEDAK